MSPSDAVFDTVCQMLVEVLSVEPDEIAPTTRFASDLGGESLDVIDLNFKLSKHYAVPMRLQELGEGAAFDERGVLTPVSLASLQQKHPFLDLSAWVDRPIADAKDLLTPEAIAGFVRAALARHQSATPAGT